jgi:hypothetical protein
MKLTQVEAARLMAAHEKVITKMVRLVSADGEQSIQRATDSYVAAKDKFRELVAKLTDSEGL